MPAFPHGGGGKAASYRRAHPPGRRGGKEETADVPASPRGGQEAAKPAPIRGRPAAGAQALAAAACRSVSTFPAAASHWNYCSSIPV